MITWQHTGAGAHRIGRMGVIHGQSPAHSGFQSLLEAAAANLVSNDTKDGARSIVTKPA